MNATCPSASAPVRRRPFAPLHRWLGRARFVPVDLADTIFASLPNREPAPAKTEVGPLPLPERPDHARAMSCRLL